MPHYNYLQPSDIEAGTDSTGDTVLRIYTNGLWDTCPDPRSDRRVQECEQRYNRGDFSSVREVRVSLAKVDAHIKEKAPGSPGA